MTNNKTTSKKKTIQNKSKNSFKVGLAVLVGLVAAFAVVKMINPYLGWKSYTLPQEKLTVRYPKDWTVETNNDTRGNEGCDLDFVSFQGPNGNTSVSVQTAFEGDGVPIDSIISSEKLTIFDDEYLLHVNRAVGAPKSDTNAAFGSLTTTEQTDAGKKSAAYKKLPVKNWTCDKNGDSSSPVLSAEVLYVSDTADEGVTPEQFTGDPNYNDIKRILESMHYED